MLGSDMRVCISDKILGQVSYTRWTNVIKNIEHTEHRILTNMLLFLLLFFGFFLVANELLFRDVSNPNFI